MVEEMLTDMRGAIRGRRKLCAAAEIDAAQDDGAALLVDEA